MTDTEQALYEIMRAIAREEIAKSKGQDGVPEWLEVMKGFSRLREIMGDDGR